MPEFVTPMGYLSNLVDMVTNRPDTSAESSDDGSESSYRRLPLRKAREYDGNSHSSASSVSSSHVTASSTSEVQSTTSSEENYESDSDSDNNLGASSTSDYEGVGDETDSQELALASKANIKDFQKTFEDSSIDPTKEKLLKVYSCAYSREILYQGKMFVTGNYICFSSRIFNVSHKICLPFRNITMIEPRRYINIFPNSIEIGMLDGRRYLFASFANRNSSLAFMRKMRRNRDSFNSEGGLSRSSSTRNIDTFDGLGQEGAAGEGAPLRANSIKRNATFDSSLSAPAANTTQTGSNSAPTTPALAASNGESTTAGGPGSGPGQGQGNRKLNRRCTVESRNRSPSATLTPNLASAGAGVPPTSQSTSTLIATPTDYNYPYNSYPSGNPSASNTGNPTQSSSNLTYANGAATHSDSSLSPGLHHGIPSAPSIYPGILNGNSLNTGANTNTVGSNNAAVTTQTPSGGVQLSRNRHNSVDSMADKRSNQPTPSSKHRRTQNNSSESKDSGSGSGSGSSSDQGKWPVANLGPEEHAKTSLPPAKEHEKVLSEEVINAPPGVVANIVFGNDTAWYKDFLVDANKNRELNELPPFPSLSTGSERKFEYVKPLSGPVGPKQTRCKSTEKIENWDVDNYLEITTTTLTPDVPAGSSFTTQTRAIFAWGDNNTTVLRLGTWLEWTGKTWLKSAIEKGAVDGQTSYCKLLVAEITKTVSSGSQGSAGAANTEKEAVDSVNSGKPSKQASGPTSKERKGDSETTRKAMEAIAAWERICVVLGISVLVLLVLLFHFWRKSRNGEALEAADGHRDLFRLQKELELWQWIDDRHKSHSSPSVAVKDANLREAIAVSEERLSKLKDALVN